MAIEDYDHVRDLARGSTPVEGVDLTVLNLPVQETFQRFSAHREWEVSEFSMALYVAMRGAGDTSVIAIPVFPSRMFRHSAMYVRADGPTRPKDLEGLRVGVPEWAQTAGVWARGILSDDYDVDLAKIDWIQGGLHSAGRFERVPLALSPGMSVRAEKDRTLEDLLLAGEIDAVITAHPPTSFVPTGGEIRCLFPDARSEEAAFWKRHHFIPIMHTVVLRKDTVERHPWLPRNFQVAFEAALDRSRHRLRDVAISRFPLPWIAETVRELESSSDRPWWGYGLEDNRRALDMFCRFAFEQGVTPHRIAPDQLFATSAAFDSKI
ncbi:ABC transporter substrate-binding protein [Pseudonocardia sp. NPDC049635]|uniref:ABC transporter substrate-binding protein n=1 Tax=Pseudonocardia sp. NPDC049635 TaxID=3155506 RepID=UPI0033CDF364